MLTIWFIAVVVQVVCSLDPCTNSIEINNKYRSVEYHYSLDAAHFEPMVCDMHLQPGWYRFTQGLNGSMPVKIPTTCVSEYHCGTHAPFWMNGTHPTVADDIVVKQICGSISMNCCRYESTIRVKNCGAFYVYELKPTIGCSMAYCAGTGVPCSRHQTSQTGYQPGCKDINGGSVITG
ncbi:oncoprotein-induced transcript 3 protein-like [Ruditapes philippinarum]|uniref:oncoprotein-induced transcript 3 protein-like n=1 Tax=Ruditapes philippinarum TaxID=129788 RepID=UPI00295C052E|nr:oncoprotein-induced transcript 3 protein-like [Ruditapes philippinarum]